MAQKKKKEREEFKKPFATLLVIALWCFGLIPLFTILYLRYVKTNNNNLPSITMLENHKSVLATVIYADDGLTEIGKFWSVNRQMLAYNEISPNVVSALISTEDERFFQHSGIDVKAVMRAVAYMGQAGGASTLSQQLAKLIFTLEQREDFRENLQDDTLTAKEEHIEDMNPLIRRLFEKVKENIIALRLERNYTKNEIITMYLNQFDFLYNAVGISSAARVYFDKKAADLSPTEAAMLVGMCKNPVLYNPYRFSTRDYAGIIAAQKGIQREEVSIELVAKERKEDSLRVINRRNTVLMKWYQNSKKNNPSLTVKLTKKEYDSLRALPIITHYQEVDFKSGIAPYYREHLRQKIANMLDEKSIDGIYKYHKKNGQPYNIYTDGLKVYTSLDVNLQRYAKAAVIKHLKKNLQEPFTKNNRSNRNFPFSNSVSKKTIEGIMQRTRHRSRRYRLMQKNGISKEKILASFDKPIPMEIFSWDGVIDTVMSPNDSIRYYKNFLQAGLVSIEPQTGFIKAWVGGPNINYFKYDHVAQGERQVGSTIKPFIYAAGMQFGVITPCETTPNIPYCVDVPDGANSMKQWCPRNAGEEMKGEPISFTRGLAHSMNNITVAVMARMGGIAGPQAVAKLLQNLNVNLAQRDIVPAMCLGVMDMSLLELTSAQCAFMNEGIYNAPSSILRIEDRYGNIVYENEHVSREAMSADLAYATLKMMRQVVLSGTGASLRGTWRGDWGGITQPTAGKTGTTQNNSDGWWMGLTPDLVTGVWVGAEDMAVRFRTMRWGQGARMALPIYGYMMQKVYKDPKIDISTEEFKAPYGFENSIYNCQPKSEESNKENNNLLDGLGI